MVRNPETFRMPTDPLEIDGDVFTPVEPDRSINPAYQIYGLTPNETFWRQQAAFLRSHGYVLRRRYQPRWMPYWPDTGMVASMHEDCWQNLNGMVMDAFRIADESLVAIKCRPTSGVDNELSLHRFLSSHTLRDDPRNHCIPLVEVLQDPGCRMPTGELGATFIVSRFVYQYDQWPFQTVANVLDFVQQTLEGIEFMHEQGVAHRDCSTSNVRVDANALFPGIWPHPVVPCMNYCEPFGLIPDPDRTTAPVRYYFIDFDEAVRRPEGSAGRPFLVEGARCIDPELPELHFQHPYDPFPVDVFLLGNMYKRSLLDVYNDLDVLLPLVDAMTAEDPMRRPTIADARRVFEGIAQAIALPRRRSRLARKDEPIIQTVVRHIATAASSTFRFVKRLH